ncbi:metallophosphoesterase family protein [Pararhizobium gei]|uniref:metallophosphoesterase family protein n=1 Tax=Pararhizobium gei TaxID=1395951 RepID=UPI0023DC886A|nr:metallophosphoesterase family protein [Rhizobium gei]
MIAGILRLLQGLLPNKPAGQRQKLFFDRRPEHIYAVGDVHGRDDLLQQMEEAIVEDSRRREGTKWVVMLGDYVDRGPGSASVLERLMTPFRADLQRFCLAGNHEEVMLDFLRNPSLDHRWLDFGGRETLHSYGLHKLPASRSALKSALRKHIPASHFRFLDDLPSLLCVPAYCFVHAGLKEGVSLPEQKDRDLLWLRPDKKGKVQSTLGRIAVHGHTPVRDVEIGPSRINVDTGAYMSGRLSAVRISGRDTPEVLQCQA